MNRCGSGRQQRNPPSGSHTSGGGQKPPADFMEPEKGMYPKCIQQGLNSIKLAQKRSHFAPFLGRKAVYLNIHENPSRFESPPLRQLSSKTLDFSMKSGVFALKWPSLIPPDTIERDLVIIRGGVFLDGQKLVAAWLLSLCRTSNSVTPQRGLSSRGPAPDTAYATIESGLVIA